MGQRRGGEGKGNTWDDETRYGYTLDCEGILRERCEQNILDFLPVG